MNVQVATKKGYLLKKSSMETKIASKFILPDTGSVEETTVSAAREGRDVKRSKMVKERWVLVKVLTRQRWLNWVVEEWVYDCNWFR